MGHQVACLWCDVTFVSPFGVARWYCGWDCRQKAKNFRKHYRRTVADMDGLLEARMRYLRECQRSQEAGQKFPPLRTEKEGRAAEVLWNHREAVQRLVAETERLREAGKLLTDDRTERRGRYG